MKVIANNKLLISGYSFSNATGSEDFMVAQVNASGALDNTFNNGSSNFMSGVATGTVTDKCNSMQLMNDGRIILVGTLVISSAVNEDCAVIRISNGQPLNLSDISFTRGISTFPNPFAGELIIETSSNELFSIYTSQGELVKSIKCATGLNHFNLIDLPLGMYFLRSENGKVVQKLIRN